MTKKTNKPNKTASVTVNVTPSLKTRIAAHARRADMTVSAFLNEMLSAHFYKRGEPKMKRIGPHVRIYDRPIRTIQEAAASLPRSVRSITVRRAANALDGPIPEHVKKANLTPNL